MSITQTTTTTVLLLCCLLHAGYCCSNPIIHHHHRPRSKISWWVSQMMRCCPFPSIPQTLIRFAFPSFASLVATCCCLPAPSGGGYLSPNTQIIGNLRELKGTKGNEWELIRGDGFCSPTSLYPVMRYLDRIPRIHGLRVPFFFCFLVLFLLLPP